MNLRKLQQAVYEAGFDAFAVMPAKRIEYMLPILREARPKPLPDLSTRRLKRIDPRNLQRSARSIVSLAVSYFTGSRGLSPLHGTVSRSAWGVDYHQVLGERMNKVIGFLKEHFGASRCTKAVDTTFLIDRAWP